MSGESRSKSFKQEEMSEEVESTTVVKDASFRRKGAETSSSGVKSTKIARTTNRPSERSFDQASESSANKSFIGGN